MRYTRLSFCYFAISYLDSTVIVNSCVGSRLGLYEGYRIALDFSRIASIWDNMIYWSKVVLLNIFPYS